MKINFLLMLSLLFGAAVTAQNYSPADASSSVKFTIKNFGLNVEGSFKGLQGKIKFLPADVTASLFSLTLDAATVNTGNGSRDSHLKKEDYFNVAKYPVIQFVSTGVKAGDKAGSYNMVGSLTIKGITKTISFPFTAAATATGYQFAGEFKINRRDFKVGGNSLVLSDMLTVLLNVSASK